MDSSLRERFARLGPIRGVDRVASGSPGTFVLRRKLDHEIPLTIDATFALARRGPPLLKAKRTIEAVLEAGRATIALPTVEDEAALIGDLDKAGFIATPVWTDAQVDVLKLRERLNLTRENFALRYGFEVETLRNWETGKRTPDKAARSYLLAIWNAPEEVEMAYSPRSTFSPEKEAAESI